MKIISFMTKRAMFRPLKQTSFCGIKHSLIYGRPTRILCSKTPIVFPFLSPMRPEILASISSQTALAPAMTTVPVSLISIKISDRLNDMAFSALLIHLTPKKRPPFSAETQYTKVNCTEKAVVFGVLFCLLRLIVILIMLVCRWMSREK